MKFKIIVKPGDWYVPYVRKWGRWKQISGGRAARTGAVLEIGEYVLKATGGEAA